MCHGAMLAEWMRAPMNAWCHVSRTTPERAEAPPHSHSQLHPPAAARRTCGWWWARSVRPRRVAVLDVIGVPLCLGFVTGTSVDPFSPHGARRAPAGLCARQHTGRNCNQLRSVVVNG